MRCLVVNAYKGEKNNKKFHEFVAVLRPILMHYDKSSTLVLRKYDNLDDFVYAPDLMAGPGDEPEDAGAAKMKLGRFDGLDMIFVDGDEGFMPWSPELSQLFGLMRLAYHSGKGLFTTITGGYMLAYINAMGGERLDVVNGNGQRLEEIKATDTTDPLLKALFEEADADGGGTLDREELVVLMKKVYTKRGLARSLKDIKEELDEAMVAYDDGDGEIDFHEFQEMVMEMRSFKEAGIKNSLEDKHFIESTMGDVYKFRVQQQVEKYVPVANIGLRRKQMKAAKFTEKQAAPFSRFIGELEVKIGMKSRPHYLFQKLNKLNFKATTSLSWDVHIDTKPFDNGIMFLASSPEGHMILEYGNAISCRFNISKRFPETLCLLDGFVCEMHAKMINDEHVDLNTVVAFRDDTHPLKVKAKAGLKLPRKVRPGSAPAVRDKPIGVPPQKWTEEVTDAARTLGEVSGRHGETFKSVIRQEVLALTVEEKEAKKKKAAQFAASVAGSSARGDGSTRAGASQTRPQSGVSRASYNGLPAVQKGRPESGYTAQTAPTHGRMRSAPAAGRNRKASAGGRPSTAQPTSFRPMSAARREKEGLKGKRPVSAVTHMSQLTEATEGTDGYDAIMVDNDYDDEDEYISAEVYDEEGSSEGSYPGGSQYSAGSAMSHPASFQSGRNPAKIKAVKVCGIAKPPVPYTHYPKLLANTRKHAGTSHISVVHSGIYQSKHELEQIEHNKSKKKWMSQKNVDTSMTQTRLKLSHAAAGRKMCGWDDIPEFVQAHAGPWEEGNYAATYKFRDLPPLPSGATPFYIAPHKESEPMKPMANQWEELDAVEAKIAEYEEREWEMGSQAMSSSTRAA